MGKKETKLIQVRNDPWLLSEANSKIYAGGNYNLGPQYSHKLFNQIIALNPNQQMYRETRGWMVKWARQTDKQTNKKQSKTIDRNPHDSRYWIRCELFNRWS